MDALTLFGVVTMAVMLACYALEDFAPAWTLGFAGACVASATYGFLQGAWPFGVVEVIWTGVALQRWRRLAARESAAAPLDEAVAIACDMHAFSTGERDRYRMLRTKLTNAVAQVAPTAIGFRVRLNDGISLNEVADWMALERRCCPFLNMTLRLPPGASRWVEIDGGPGVKAFLEAEFGVAQLPVESGGR